jgi:hypothetical protein
MHRVVLLVTMLILVVSSAWATAPTPTPSPAGDPKCVGVQQGQACGETAPKPGAVTAKLLDPVASTLNFQQWVGILGDVFESIEAKKLVRSIALALIGIGAFFLALQILQKGGLFDGFQFILIRTVVAAAAFAASEPIGDLWKDTWHWGYSYSVGSMRNIYVESAQQLAKVSGELPSAIVKVQTIRNATTGVSTASVQVAGKDESPDWLETLWMALLVPLSGLMYACLSGVYSFGVMASAMTIVLGKILFPLVAALLILPGGTGVMWFSKWANAMTGATLMGFFLPVIYGIASFVAVLIPLSHLSAFFDFINQTVDYLKQTLATPQALGYKPDIASSIVSGLANAWGVADVIGTVVKITGMMLVLPAAVIIGLVIAGTLIARAGPMLASLIGGVVVGGGYENPIARAAAAVYGPGAITGAVGAAGAAAGAVGGAAGAALGAARGAVGAAGSAASGAARTAGTAALMNYGGIRAAPAMNLQGSSISRSVSGANTVRPGGMKVGGGGGTPPKTLDAAAVDHAARLQNSSSGRFNDSYRSGAYLRSKMQGRR